MLFFVHTVEIPLRPAIALIVRIELIVSEALGVIQPMRNILVFWNKAYHWYRAKKE